MGNELSNRILKFVVEIINFNKGLGESIEMRVIRQQLIRSDSSTGANYEESHGAGSMADFSNKVRIALKESRETNYWLRLLRAICTNRQGDIDAIINESNELTRILGSIASKTRNLKK